MTVKAKRAGRIIRLLDSGRLSFAEARRMAGLGPYISTWTCPTCDDGDADGECECYVIQRASERDMRERLEALR